MPRLFGGPGRAALFGVQVCGSVHITMLMREMLKNADFFYA